MPIIKTNTFWNYIVNESEPMLERIKDILTRKDYNFEEKKYETSTYYTITSEIIVDSKKYKTLRFPAGLTDYILSKQYLETEEKEYTTPKYTAEQVLEIAKEVQQINQHFEIRDYQLEAVLTSLNKFSSLIVSSIGSGKTSMMALVTKVLKDNKILILNDNNFILDQIHERILSFGIEDISFNSGGKPDFTKRICLFNTAGSDSRLKAEDPDYIKFLSNINTLIYDEAHHSQSFTAFAPIFYTTENLKHIIGYSGSPFRNKKDAYKDPQDFRTIAILGEPAFIYDMADTIADGNIAQPYGYFIKFDNKPSHLPAQFKDNYFMQYRSNITYNKNRIKAGLEMLKFLDRNGIKTLASFNNIKPGQKLMEQLYLEGVKSLFICGAETIYEYKDGKNGKPKLEKRKGTPKDARYAMENGYNIIFGSTVLDEGVDLDIFQAVVLFSAGKTPIAGIQRIGRASRKRKSGSNISFVIDFQDVGGYYIFTKHYKERRQMMIDSGVKIFDNVYDFINLVEEIKREKEDLEN